VNLSPVLASAWQIGRASPLGLGAALEASQEFPELSTKRAFKLQNVDEGEIECSKPPAIPTEEDTRRIACDAPGGAKWRALSLDLLEPYLDFRRREVAKQICATGKEKSRRLRIKKCAAMTPPEQKEKNT